MRLVTLGMLLALGTGPAAYAQAATDPFDICAREQDASARLACFDRQIAARRATAPVSAAPSVAVEAPKPVPVTSSSSEIGLDSRQLHKLHPERAESDNAGLRIEGKVVRVIARRPLISAFELDNGQVWEQSETVAGLWVKPQEPVTIREGAIGSFLLKSADGHVVRVHRLK